MARNGEPHQQWYKVTSDLKDQTRTSLNQY